MTLRELKLLVKQGESAQLEFKRKVAHPDKVIREVVAFANSEGGTLLIGVNDNGEISGLKYADEEDYIMRKALVELCRPVVQFTSGAIKMDEQKSVLYYHIKPSRKKPHYALETAGQRWGKAYVRKDDRSIQASREMIEVLRRSRRNKAHSFQYGEAEKQLLQLLEEKGELTVNEFAQLARLPMKRASRIVVTLTLTNVLKIIPREKEDVFVFNHLPD